MSDLSSKANSELNALYAFPGLRKVTVEKKIFQEIMLYTGGEILVAGRSYEITSKNLGAGIFRLQLKRSNP